MHVIFIVMNHSVNFHNVWSSNKPSIKRQLLWPPIFYESAYCVSITDVILPNLPLTYLFSDINKISILTKSHNSLQCIRCFQANRWRKFILTYS